MRRTVGLCLGLACCWAGMFIWTSLPSQAAAPGTGQPSAPLAPIARPVDLVLLPELHRLVIANSDAASLAQIDTERGVVVGEWQLPVSGRIADLSASPDGRWFLVTRPDRDELCLLERLGDAEFKLTAVLPTPQSPARTLWLPDQKTVALTCSWGQKLLLLDLVPDEQQGLQLKQRAELDLQYPAREMTYLPSRERLLVVDAFGGRFSIVDPQAAQIVQTVSIPGHNLHGVTVMPRGERVLVAHQILNQVAETSRDGVFWGIVMTNNIRLIPFENFLDPKIEPLYGADIHFLGEPRSGAGDPEGVAVTPNETMVIALGGVDQVAIGQHIDHSFDRVPVGERPVAVVADPEGKFAYVANSLSDSISIVEIEPRKHIATIPLRPERKPEELTAVERGERSFYDSRLSLDEWYSCHSCHSEGHTISLLNDNLGDGNYGAPKRIPSLLGVSETAPWLWTGHRTDLAEQTRRSIMTTMHGEQPPEQVLLDLVAYMETLPPPPRPKHFDREQAARGQQIFEARGCAECHAPPTYTSEGAYDVGIKDQLGQTKFNPPSLRGLRFRPKYFHDHRAKSLVEVFRDHKHPREQSWTDEELNDLIGFLQSL